MTVINPVSCYQGQEQKNMTNVHHFCTKLVLVSAVAISKMARQGSMSDIFAFLAKNRFSSLNEKKTQRENIKRIFPGKCELKAEKANSLSLINIINLFLSKESLSLDSIILLIQNSLILISTDINSSVLAFNFNQKQT